MGSINNYDECLLEREKHFIEIWQLFTATASSLSHLYKASVQSTDRASKYGYHNGARRMRLKLRDFTLLVANFRKDVHQLPLQTTSASSSVPIAFINQFAVPLPVLLSYVNLLSSSLGTKMSGKRRLKRLGRPVNIKTTSSDSSPFKIPHSDDSISNSEFEVPRLSLLDKSSPHTNKSASHSDNLTPQSSETCISSKPKLKRKLIDYSSLLLSTNPEPVKDEFMTELVHPFANCTVSSTASSSSNAVTRDPCCLAKRTKLNDDGAK